MSDRVPLPENIRPFTLFGITGSFMMLETVFVNKKHAYRLRPRLHHGSEPRTSDGCATRYRLREDLRRESIRFPSRLARSLTQVIKTASDIAERGIALKVLTQNIDTSTSEGRLFFHMTAAFDEFQRELIVENTRAGLKATTKRGR
jgi:hypothetical protein